MARRKVQVDQIVTEGALDALVLERGRMLKDDGEPMPEKPLRDRLNAAGDQLAKVLVGRGNAINCILLSFVTGLNFCLVGEKGSGKTLLARLAYRHVEGASVYVELCGSFVTEDRLFGPVNIEAFKRGEWQRVTKGRLAAVELAFLDEVMKTNPGALNTMLGVLNEREYEGQRTPLWVAGGATNWPEVRSKSDNVDALWDRFVLRCPISRLDADQRSEMLGVAEAIRNYEPEDTFTIAELREAAVEVRQIKVRPRVRKALVNLVQQLDKEGLVVSDRRLMQMLSVVQAHAWLAGRDDVKLDDFQALFFGLWEEERHIGSLEVLLEAIDGEAYKNLVKLLSAAITETNGFEQAKATMAPDIARRCSNASRDAGAILKDNELTEAHVDEVKGQIAILQERFRKMRTLIDGELAAKPA